MIVVLSREIQGLRCLHKPWMWMWWVICWNLMVNFLSNPDEPLWRWVQRLRPSFHCALTLPAPTHCSASVTGCSVSETATSPTLWSIRKQVAWLASTLAMLLDQLLRFACHFHLNLSLYCIFLTSSQSSLLTCCTRCRWNMWFVFFSFCQCQSWCPSGLRVSLLVWWSPWQSLAWSVVWWCTRSGPSGTSLISSSTPWTCLSKSLLWTGRYGDITCIWVEKLFNYMMYMVNTDLQECHCLYIWLLLYYYGPLYWRQIIFLTEF